MKEATPTTEERIRAAARQLFLEKGYDGTTSRDLAKAAGLNVSMTNYYFRSKEQLFKLTFTELHQQLFAKLIELFDREVPLREKVQLMIETEFELMAANPDLPMFVLYELQHNPHLFTDWLPPLLTPDSLFIKQVQEAVASGHMPDIQPIQIPMLIMANVHHPYIARKAIAKTLNQNVEDLSTVMARHQQTVQDMLMGYLFKPSG